MVASPTGVRTLALGNPDPGSELSLQQAELPSFVLNLKSHRGRNLAAAKLMKSRDWLE
jgi:hypothetical protein